MVQIFIKLDKENTKDWTIIELQGCLESQQQDLSGVKIGDLHFDARGNPSLIIGHHVLTGKVVSLEKPFAVMKKNFDHEEGISVEHSMEADITNETSYKVVAFVKQKVMFKSRPRPIIVSTKPIRR